MRRASVPHLLIGLAAALLGCGAPRPAAKPVADPEVRPATVDRILAAVREPGARVVLRVGDGS